MSLVLLNLMVRFQNALPGSWINHIMGALHPMTTPPTTDGGGGGGVEPIQPDSSNVPPVVRHFFRKLASGALWVGMYAIVIIAVVFLVRGYAQAEKRGKFMGAAVLGLVLFVVLNFISQALGITKGFFDFYLLS